jgi:hypothetical protein
MSWYKVELTPEEISNSRYIALQETFEDLFAAADSPKGAAMVESSIPTDYIYYFSPGAVTIAMPLITAFNGVPCSAPAQSSVKALVFSGGLEDIPFRSLY